MIVSLMHFYKKAYCVIASIILVFSILGVMYLYLKSIYIYLVDLNSRKENERCTY